MENCRLIGTVDARLDTKGRVFLPAAFRRCLHAEEGFSLILRKDIFENCLVLYTQEERYNRLDVLRSRLSQWNRQQRQIFRQFVSDAEWVTLDAGGRFLIPKRYLKMVGIEQEITFVGMDDTIEIWAKGCHADGFSSDLGNLLENTMDAIPQ